MRGVPAVVAVALLGISPSSSATGRLDTIVVKFRGDAGLADLRALPEGHRFIVVKAIRTGATTIGRTRDGAFRIALDPPLTFVEGQTAIDRLRMDQHILYANSTSRVEPSKQPRATAKVAPSEPPLKRIIVK